LCDRHKRQVIMGSGQKKSKGESVKSLNATSGHKTAVTEVVNEDGDGRPAEPKKHVA